MSQTSFDQVDLNTVLSMIPWVICHEELRIKTLTSDSNPFVEYEPLPRNVVRLGVKQVVKIYE